MERSGEEIALERIREARESGGTEVDLSNLRLTELPWEVLALTQLETLKLGGDFWREEKNQLSELPAEIGQLTELQYLDLFSNQLSALPAGLGKLERLEYLGACRALARCGGPARVIDYEAQQMCIGGMKSAPRALFPGE